MNRLERLEIEMERAREHVKIAQARLEIAIQNYIEELKKDE